MTTSQLVQLYERWGRGAQVDPFDAQEAKPYKNDPQVLVMTNLVAAYQSNNISDFEQILATNKCVCMHGPAVHLGPICNDNSVDDSRTSRPASPGWELHIPWVMV